MVVVSIIKINNLVQTSLNKTKVDLLSVSELDNMLTEGVKLTVD